MFIHAALILGSISAIGNYMILVRDAFTWWGRILATVGLLAVMAIMGSVVQLAFMPVMGQRVMYRNHKHCQSYQWLDQDWKCVPWEEAG